MPKLAVEGARRRRLLNVRTTDEMRGRLEDASRISGLPLIDEIERRLERSFLADDLRTLIREEIRAALWEDRNADPLLHATHCHTGVPRRAAFERRLSGSDIPLTGPEREAFLDGMEAVGRHFGSAPEHT